MRPGTQVAVVQVRVPKFSRLLSLLIGKQQGIEAAVQIRIPKFQIPSDIKNWGMLIISIRATAPPFKFGFRGVVDLVT